MNRLTIAIQDRKKFLAALLGVVIAVFGDRAGVDANALLLAVSTIIAYIAGTAIEDGLRGRN
jgi:hypothetical protein